MMYIEHFVLLAGAYNLGFFLFELAEYFIFLKFFILQVQKLETKKNIFYKYTKKRNSVICLPVPSTRSGIPPPVKDSEHLINHLHLSNDITI